MSYLVGYLRDVAVDIVCGIRFCTENYELTRKTMSTRFNRTQTVPIHLLMIEYELHPLIRHRFSI